MRTAKVFKQGNSQAVTLDATRVGRDASRIAEEVIAHLAGLVDSTVTVTYPPFVWPVDL
jgi:hypothetical protein